MKTLSQISKQKESDQVDHLIDLYENNLESINENKLKEILNSLSKGDAVDIVSLLLSPKSFTKASLGRILTDKLNRSGIIGDKTASVVDNILKYAPLVFQK